MNARQMLAKLDGYGGIIPFNSEELEVTLRALRLLAAAEGGEETPETDAAVYDLGYRDESGQWIKQDAIPIDFAQGMERQRNALAQRLAEREEDAARYRWLKANKIGYNGQAWHWVPGEPLWDANLDAAVDAARGTK